MTPMTALTLLLPADLARNSAADNAGWLLLAGIVLVVWFFGWLKRQVEGAREYKRLKPRLDNLDALEKALARDRQQWQGVVATEKRSLETVRQVWQTKVAADREAIRILAEEKAKGFPWLAEAYADYFALQDENEARILEKKVRPAPVAAAKVREIAAKRREAERLYRVHRYQLQFYEKLFPWLAEFREIEDEDLLPVETSTESTSDEEEPDPARRYLSQAEYEKLSREEKFQRALDRYWSSRKTSWQIGRDYERYIGYLYEKDGWDVTYFGIVKGFEDLGRDLLVEKEGQTRVIQCKCWASHKTIHEKHIFQLFGTTLEYCLSRGVVGESGKSLLEAPVLPLPVQPVFCTSTSLSDEAKRFAIVLGVVVHEKRSLARYPCIKCNYTREHGKIYHLPFDQQYDRTKIQDPRTERFVETVAEAEALRYRRAHRWRGQPVTTS